MNEELFDRVVAVWHISDEVNFHSLKGATVEYFIEVRGSVVRRKGVFTFTFAGVSGAEDLPLLRIDPLPLEGSAPRWDLTPVFPPEVAREIEVHPQQEVAKFLVRKAFAP